MPPVGFEPTFSAGERPVAARLLRSWVRIPPGAWIFVCCECGVLSGRGLGDELITRPEESYRLWCIVVCDLETSRMGAPYIYDISRLRVNLGLLLHGHSWLRGISSDFNSEVGRFICQIRYRISWLRFLVLPNYARRPTS